MSDDRSPPKRRKMVETTTAAPIVTRSGYVVGHVDLCRVIMQALGDLGLARSQEALEKETGVSLFGPATSRLSGAIEAGEWAAFLEKILPGLPWQDSDRLQLAKEAIFRIWALDLCLSGDHEKAIECIRNSPESLHGPLSSLLLFKEGDELRKRFTKMFGADALSRSWLRNYIQNLLDDEEFLGDQRLLSLIDDAYLLQAESGTESSEPLWTATSRESSPERTLLTPKRLRLSFRELVEILHQAIDDFGYETAASAILEESRIPSDSAIGRRFRETVLSGEWSEVYALLPQLRWEGDAGFCNAENAVRKQNFLELCESGDFSQAIECLRHFTGPANLSRFVMFTDPAQLREAAAFDGAQGTSRSQLWRFLQRQCARNSGIRPARLLDLIDDAIDYRIRHCLYHNSSRTCLFSLLKPHSCLDKGVPSICIQTLCGHIDEIWFIAFSYDGTRFASASKDSTIRIWESTDDQYHASWQQLHCLRSGARHVSFLCWSDDSAYLVTCGSKKRVSVWDARSGVRICTLKGHKDHVLACAWVHGRNPSIVTGSVDHQIILWSLNGDRLYNWRTQSAIHDICVSRDGRFLFASAAQYTVQIVDLQTRELVNDFREETQQITSLAMSADSTMLLLTVVKSAEIHLWSVRDISNPVLVRKFCGAVQEKFIVRCAFGGVDDVFVVSGSEDCSVLIWNRHTGDQLVRLAGHQGSVNSVSWHPSNPFIFASASDDHTVRIWAAPQLQTILERTRFSN